MLQSYEQIIPSVGYYTKSVGYRENLTIEKFPVLMMSFVNDRYEMWRCFNTERKL